MKDLLGSLDSLRARHRVEEREVLRKALVASRWSLRGAARILGVIPRTIQLAMIKYPDLDTERRRRAGLDAERAA